jgi:hypothetical protein
MKLAAASSDGKAVIQSFAHAGKLLGHTGAVNLSWSIFMEHAKTCQRPISLEDGLRQLTW